MKKLENYLIVPLLGGMILLVFIQIVCRWLGRSISFTEEINQQMFIWTTMLGVALAVRPKELLGLQLLSRTGSERRRRLLGAIAWIALLIYGGAMVLLSLQMVATQMRTGKILPATGWPIWPIGLAVPLGFLLILGRAIASRRNGDETTDDKETVFHESKAP